jgi:hypothetical protein
LRLVEEADDRNPRDVSPGVPLISHSALSRCVEPHCGQGISLLAIATARRVCELVVVTPRRGGPAPLAIFPIVWVAFVPASVINTAYEERSCDGCRGLDRTCWTCTCGPVGRTGASVFRGRATKYSRCTPSRMSVSTTSYAAAAKRMLGEPMANLSDGERILHVARRKELYEKLHPETKHGGDRRSAGARSSSLTPMRCSAGAPREKLRTTPCKGRSVKQKDLSSRRQLRVREPARSCTWLCTLAQRMAPGSKGKPS